MRALEKLEDEVALLVTSWLSSFATTQLRAGTRACRRLFLRNIAVATSDHLFLEQVVRPEGHCISLVEHPHFNRHSPLRCWRLRLHDVADVPGARLPEALRETRLRAGGRREPWKRAGVRRHQPQERQRKRLGGRRRQRLRAGVRRRQPQERQRRRLVGHLARWRRTRVRR